MCTAVGEGEEGNRVLNSRVTDDRFSNSAADGGGGVGEGPLSHLFTETALIASTQLWGVVEVGRRDNNVSACR